MSGGTGLFFDNETPSPSEFKHFLTVHSMRRDNSAYSSQPPPNGWGYCGASSGLPGARSNWDENTNSTTGYACLDQPGRGIGDLLSGAFPNTVNVTRGNCTYDQTCAYPRQALEPIYIWNNPFTPMAGMGGSNVGGQTTDVVENRDWYADWNANCSQNGPACTSGVGRGTLAQRPVRCTAGTAWWASDQGGNWHKANSSLNDGQLFKCTATDTWTPFYTPYTYPHPLRASEPQAPTNMRIVW
jgi:hypothetical protein